jgi:hypothetical protein
MSATPISSKYFLAIVAIYDTTRFANQFLTSSRHHFFIKLASTDQNKTVQALQFYKRLIRFVL